MCTSSCNASARFVRFADGGAKWPSGGRFFKTVSWISDWLQGALGAGITSFPFGMAVIPTFGGVITVILWSWIADSLLRGL